MSMANAIVLSTDPGLFSKVAARTLISFCTFPMRAVARVIMFGGVTAGWPDPDGRVGCTTLDLIAPFLGAADLDGEDFPLAEPLVCEAFPFADPLL
jgi:hypothetical protein